MFNYLKNKTIITNSIAKNLSELNKSNKFNFITVTEKLCNKNSLSFLNVRNFAFKFTKNDTNRNSNNKNKNENKFVRLYPKDKVAIMPAFGDVDKLSHFEKRIIKKYDIKDTKIKLATINKINRKKNLAWVSNNTTKNKFIDPNVLGYNFENGSLDIIKHHKESVPIALNRLTLYTKVEKNKNKEVVKLQPAKLIKRRDNSIRVDAKTKRVFPVNLPTSEEIEKLRQKKHESKKPSPLDTDYKTAVKSTYIGEDYEEVTKNFLRRIFTKVSTERKLILKDK
jgi:hypothetical protein